MSVSTPAEGQTWDPDEYARNARFVSDLGQPVIDLLAPRAGERILDLGCGDGVLTEQLVAMGCRVVGIDASAEQAAAARQRGLDATVGDGERLAFDGEFDAVFSNAALHWMKRPDAVIDGVWRALRPGGRFVAECGGAGCIATIARGLEEALGRRGLDAAALNPWYFPTDVEYRAKLEARGWLDTFARAFTSSLPASEQRPFIEEVRERLRPSLCDADGHWTADYVRLRFSARRPVD